jgi:hypothetical protein
MRITVRPPARGHRTGWERNASAFVWPYRPDAETAPLRENDLSRYPRACQASFFIAAWPFSGGAALHARNEGTGFTEAYPARPRPLGYASGRNEMPRHPYGLARRTHRVRPSEKIALRVIPGFSPQGHPSSDHESRGGAGSARPQGMPRFSPGISTYWPRPMTTVRAKPNFLGTRRA